MSRHHDIGGSDIINNDDEEDSRITYLELASAGAPQAAVEETYDPVLYPGIRCPDKKLAAVLPPKDGSVEECDVPPVYLVRDVAGNGDGNGSEVDPPLQAYALIDNKSISLNHHDPNWGYVHFAVLYPEVFVGNSANGSSNTSTSSNNNGGTRTFQAPSGTPEYVAIKQLNKKAVARYLDRGGQENPFKEIDRMQELGDDVHVLRCVEALQDDEYLYIITPKACPECGTLKDLIPWFSKSGALDPDRVRQIYRQLLDILLYLARNDICHRDLSPDNFLFLTPDRLVVFDLALSLRVPRAAAVPGQQHRKPHRLLMLPQGNFGTFSYMVRVKLRLRRFFLNCRDSVVF